MWGSQSSKARKNLVRFGAGLAAIAVVALILYAIRGTPSAENHVGGAIQEPAPQDSSVSSSDTSENAPRAGPANVQMESARNYQSLASCAKVSRLRAAFSAQELDPSSWLSSDAAASDVSADDLAAIENSVEFYNEWEGRCRAAATEVRQVEDIYLAALESARAGDVEAAHCFLLAPWQPGDGAFPDSLKLTYRENAVRLRDIGIEAGYWPMVNLMIAAYAAPTDGLLPLAFTSDIPSAYGYARLKELALAEGSGQEQEQITRDASSLRERISTDDAVAQDEWAARTLNANFLGNVSDISSTGQCVY